MRQPHTFGFGKMSDSTRSRQVRVGLQLRYGGNLVHGEFVSARRPSIVQLRCVRWHASAAEQSGQAGGYLV